ncbi:hypothetical protein HUA78_31415 [Myxococcus sp. CA033]|nr:hypothetical protein [Myxococcus sp. CA033]NTX38964.1 hypothetical protein [Myxococcus sp. CA033]
MSARAPSRVLVACLGFGVLSVLGWARPPPGDAQSPGAIRGAGARKKERVTTFALVPLSKLRVTQGALRERTDGRLDVEGARLRAIVPGTNTTSRAELRFSLRGSSSEQRALQSGEQRQQVGLKLRARDGCNVLYVMWRFAPKADVVVNYKRNPDQHHSSDCGNRGYVTVRPFRRSAVSAPSKGEEHALRAELAGVTLRVWADDSLVWEGDLPPEALALDGPVGLRSDNVRLTLQLRVPPP